MGSNLIIPETYEAVDAPMLIRVPSPSLGTSAIFTLSTQPDYGYKLLSVMFAITCSATVVNRQLLIEYQDPTGNYFYQAYAMGVVAASETGKFFGNNSAGDSTGYGNSNVSLPDIILEYGYKLKFTAVNLTGTDQLSNICLYVLPLRRKHIHNVDKV